MPCFCHRCRLVGSATVRSCEIVIASGLKCGLSRSDKGGGVESGPAGCRGASEIAGRAKPDIRRRGGRRDPSCFTMIITQKFERKASGEVSPLKRKGGVLEGPGVR